MARYDHLPIFQLAYRMCVNCYRIVKNFKREYKYTLGEKLKNNSQKILDLVIETNSLENCHKPEILGEMFLEIEKQKICWRVACDLNIISIGLLDVISKDIENLETQHSNWLNWLRNEAKKSGGGLHSSLYFTSIFPFSPGEMAFSPIRRGFSSVFILMPIWMIWTSDVRMPRGRRTSSLRETRPLSAFFFIPILAT